jgi:hypothetical protein
LTVALTLPSGKSRRDRPVTCCIAGDVAREFVAYYREGDRGGFEFWRPGCLAWDRGFADSPLEGDGFEPSVPGDNPSLSHAQIDVAARHYEGHALEHRHVVKRARIHSDHIGRFA